MYTGLLHFADTDKLMQIIHLQPFCQQISKLFVSVKQFETCHMNQLLYAKRNDNKFNVAVFWFFSVVSGRVKSWFMCRFSFMNPIRVFFSKDKVIFVSTSWYI